MRRNLSGVYFRYKKDKDSKPENYCFEELPLTQQRKVLQLYNREQLESLCLVLAKTLNLVGDEFNIIRERKYE